MVRMQPSSEEPLRIPIVFPCTVTLAARFYPGSAYPAEEQLHV